MENIKRMFKILLAGAFLAACAAPPDRGDTISIGAKWFTEQQILGNMLVQLLEYHTDLEVSYYPNMSTYILFNAIQSQDIDLYIEYTGTVYMSLLGYEEILPADETFEISVLGLQRYGIMMLPPLGFNNTFVLAVRPDTASEFGLATFSDLAEVGHYLELAGGFEVMHRPDGIPGLRERYNIEFAAEHAMEDALRYIALSNDDVQIIITNSTDGMLVAHGLVVLEDDLAFFPPYHAAPVISAASAEQHPQVVELLGMLEGIFTDDSMRELNYRVDVLHQNPADVARDFLTLAGLIS